LLLGSDEGKLKKNYLIASTHEYLRVPVPFCEQCAARQMRWQKRGERLLWLAMIAALGLGIWLHLERWGVGLLTLILVSVPLWLIFYRDWVVRVSRYDRETITFSFKNREYAQEFMRINTPAPSSRPLIFKD
jgi:hypothetical protein